MDAEVVETPKSEPYTVCYVLYGQNIARRLQDCQRCLGWMNGRASPAESIR